MLPNIYALAKINYEQISQPKIEEMRSTSALLPADNVYSDLQTDRDAYAINSLHLVRGGEGFKVNCSPLFVCFCHMRS